VIATLLTSFLIFNMATQSLGRIFFPFYKKTSADSGRSNSDPSGVFSCNLNAARFLDINDLQIPLRVIEYERRSGGRSITLADGTKLTPTSAGANIAASNLIKVASGRGSRTVILLTGKQIADTARVKNKANAFHTISFRFPSFATCLDISIALGQIIPPTKIKNPPNASDVWGHFTVKGGRRYPIMAQADAEADTSLEVINNDQEQAGLVAQNNVKRARKAAG
jgi:hypothetical protein